MKVNNVLIRKFKAPSYKMPFWVIVSDNITKAIDTVEDLIDYKVAPPDAKTVDAYTFAYVDHHGVKRVLVFVTPRLRPGRIAHEANHAMNLVLHWSGVKPSYVNDEAEGYLLEDFVDKIHNVINQFNK